MAVKKEKKKFTEKQLKCIQLLARKEYENFSFDQIAKMVPCSKTSIFKWLEDIDFKNEVAKVSMSLITDLAPTILKTTADLLQSKDDRVRSKGIDVFLKATEKMEQMQKVGLEEVEEIDFETIMDLFAASPRVNNFGGDYNRYYNAVIKSNRADIKILTIDYIAHKRKLELLKQGKKFESIEKLLENYEPSKEEYKHAIKEIFRGVV